MGKILPDLFAASAANAETERKNEHLEIERQRDKRERLAIWFSGLSLLISGGALATAILAYLK